MNKPVKEGGEPVFLDAMLDAMAGRGHPSDAIERQEARGQKQLVMSDSLPTGWSGVFGKDEQRKCDEILRELGFELGEPFEDDPLFRPAKLPEGWSKDTTDHAMHSIVRDDKGFERLGIFYKAAFYDRKADLYFNYRVKVRVDPRHAFDPEASRMVVEAATPGQDILILASFESKSGQDQPFKEKIRAEQEARDWIEQHYPDYKNPRAYWDLDLDSVGARFTPKR